MSHSKNKAKTKIKSLYDKAFYFNISVKPLMLGVSCLKVVEGTADCK